MDPIALDHPFRSAVKHGWFRFVGATRSKSRFAPFRQKRRRPAAREAFGGPPPIAREIDPVALTVLAINRLGPAMMRAVVYGKPLVVEVPDAQVGEIFRAALAVTQHQRVTDRLIQIVVDDSSDSIMADSPGSGRRH
jgi:hypothetical protein